MRPGVAGRSDRDVWRAVFVAEMRRVTDPHRAVILCGRRNGGEAARLSVQRGSVARRGISPVADLVRHEADAIHALTIVEPDHVDRAVLKPEMRRDLHIRERIAGGRSLE